MAMLKTQQLVQVGRLLAGIVHEIRGPLAVIRGSAEVLLFSHSPESDDYQWIDAILRNSQLLQLRLDHLCGDVVQQLVASARYRAAASSQGVGELISQGAESGKS